MIFNEIYGAYYNTVTKIINEILKAGSIDKSQLQEIINKNAFLDSYLEISQAIKEERWSFINKDYTTNLENPPKLPLTSLQLRWLRALVEDKRIKLFLDEIPYQLWNYEPLFSPNDLEIYDKYDDHDNYDSKFYIKVFRTILDAIKEEKALKISITTRRDTHFSTCVVPKRLEYSEKDDKFRLIAIGNRSVETVNLSSITACEIVATPTWLTDQEREPKIKTLTLELYDKRNALERVMLHFAHFKKQASRIDKDKYLVNIEYNERDETELVIRVLSFGPTVRAIAPDTFVALTKERLEKQAQLFKKLH
ncbi:MAG: WYL domain-containing protein [Clostridia bacterium]|nr:WYL domain-containing protein [Clostridia bacterium]